MLFLTLYLFLVAASLGIGILAGASDIRGMTIPNIHSLLILGAFPLCYGVCYLAGVDVFASPLSHLISLLIVFGVSAGLFALKIMGAADSKLASAYALWLGVPGLMPFLFYMMVAGGVLGVAALLIRRFKPFTNPSPQSWIGQLQAGADKVPYGVAIVIGAFVSFGFLGYLGTDVLSAFLATP